MSERVRRNVRTYEAENPIRVFDDYQERDAREQAVSMRGSDQPFQENIKFGRNWAKVGLAYAREDYETARARRVLRELEEFEELEELEEESA